MFESYPDAHLVWLHRDPVQVAASRTMMMADIAEGIVGPVDLHAEAKKHLEMTRASIANTMSNPMVGDPRILHIRYADFVADPTRVIRGFYEKYDLPFTSAFEAAMADYLANNKSDRYGKFKYSTDIIGEDLDKLHAEFAPYRERFGLAIEQRK